MSLIEKYLIGSVHHPLSCSKYPAWKKCGKFEGGSIDPKDLTHPANRGTIQHALIEQYISKQEADEDIIQELTGDEVDGCNWVYEWVADNAHGVVLSEQNVQYVDDDFEVLYTSQLDVEWVDKDGILHIADIKTGNERNYMDQLAGYALGKMQELGITECVCHELYSKLRKDVNYMFLYDDAKAEVDLVIAKRRAGIAEKCSYCSWCKHLESCEPVVTDVVKVAEGYSGNGLNLDSWHPSELTDPNQMLVALQVAKVLEDWCKSVKHHANDMAIKQGLPIPGTKIKTRKGKQSLTDVNEAFSLSGFTPEQFLSVCTVSVPKLADIEKELTGESKAKARKSLESRLGAVIKSAKDSTFLELEK